jgi:hypothetical protein
VKITSRVWGRLGQRQKDAYDRVLEVLSIQRRDEVSMTRAAHEAETSIRTVRKYAGEVLERDTSGRYRVKSGDRLVRPMRITSTDGTVEASVRGSAVASLNARHANAVKQYLNTGDTSVLTPFEGRRVAGRVLETDPDRLDELARRGFLDWLSIYTIHS